MRKFTEKRGCAIDEVHRFLVLRREGTGLSERTNCVWCAQAHPTVSSLDRFYAMAYTKNFPSFDERVQTIMFFMAITHFTNAEGEPHVPAATR
jgi:hypothetical protein